jgi:hypothetical protein
MRCRAAALKDIVAFGFSLEALAMSDLPLIRRLRAGTPILNANSVNDWNHDLSQLPKLYGAQRSYLLLRFRNLEASKK